MLRRWAWPAVLAVGGVALAPLLGRSAPEGADPAAAEIVAQVALSESAIQSGEVRFQGKSRTVRFDGDVDEAVARKQLAANGKPFGELQGTVWFAGKNLREDSKFKSPTIERVTAVAVKDEVRRTVWTQGDRIEAVVEPDAAAGVSPGLSALLSGNTAAELAAVTWAAVKPAGKAKALLAERGRKALMAVIDPQQGHRVVQFTTATRSAAGDVVALQVAKVGYQMRNGILYPATIQELRVGRVGDSATATLLDVTVDAPKLNDPVDPARFALTLPKGAQVTDSRTGTAVEYALKERELTLAEVKELVIAKAAAVPEPEPGAAPPAIPLNQPAPALELPVLDGKTAKLADYRGKVVLLNWFASW